MNNDLISREALKEAIRKRLCISSLKYLTAQEKVIVEEIDNAPAVPMRGQELGCEICVNRNIKSKEVCTSPFGECKFFNCGAT